MNRNVAQNALQTAAGPKWSRMPQRLSACAVAGLLTVNSAWACTSLTGADNFTASEVLRQNLTADQPLTDWKGNATSAQFGGCRSRVAQNLEFTPSFPGLTYVRDVTVSGMRFSAYGWGPQSPLIIFLHRKIAESVKNEHTPLDAHRITNSTGIPGTAGSNRDDASLWTHLNYMLLSRGGPMTSVRQTTLRGFTRMPDARVEMVGHLLTLTVTLPALTCQLQAAAVVLPDVRTSDLPSRGRTAGDRPLTVNMDCPSAGIPVTLTLTGQHGPVSADGGLAPAPGTTAAGVRVRLLRNGQPVEYAKAWNHGTSQAGLQQIPFTAQYIRTDATLLPGTVKGEAVLQADYR